MQLQWRELLSPLAFASYAALAAVWLGSVAGQFGAASGSVPLAASAALVFTLGWMWGLACPEGFKSRYDDAAMLTMILASFALIWLSPYGASPVLLVLLACSLAFRFRGTALVGALVLMNLAYLAILLARTNSAAMQALVTVFAFAGFQGFSVLVIIALQRAEQMAEQLRQVNASLLATRSLLDESARESERLRVSRELHDVAGHKLTALKLNLRALGRDPALAAQREFEVAGALADELLEDIRAVVRQLRQHEGLDLQEALQRLAEPLPRPRVEIEVADDARVRNAEQAEALLRVAQEGLTNAARHSGAQRAWLRLHRTADALEMSVEDDGHVRLPVKPGNGLTGMRERIEQLGGSLETGASARGGLRLAARLPLEVTP